MRRSDSDPFSTLVSVARAVSIYLYSHLNHPYWKRLANQYLQDVEVSFCADGLLTRGRAGSLTVSILGSPARTQVVIGIPGPPGFNEVCIRPERYTLWKGQEIEVGSELFDKIFFIVGPMRLVFALLDAETRNLLLHASREISKRIKIVDGELIVEVKDRQLPRVLPLLLKIGEWFNQPVEIGDRLIWNATRDPEDKVRIKNLLVLARELPGDPRTRGVLRAACSDRSPEVRLRAGKALGAEGLPVLVKLTEDLEDDSVSAEAVSMLGLELPSGRTRDVLHHALNKNYQETARACMLALSRDGNASVGVLVKVLEHEREDLAVFAAQMLEKIGSPEAEGPLILALQRDRPALRIAAANALARAGSPEAVLPLKEAAERFPRDLKLGQATRQAIVAIQLRLPGASPGQLSLTGADAGQLSLAQAEAGQLSLSTDPVGQLSLSSDVDKPGED